MRVLSIDLDYCMDTCARMLDSVHVNHYIDENPVSRWKGFKDHTFIPDQSIFIDDDKVEYCFNVFKKALEYCDSVMFAYDHDAILYRLEMDDAYDLEIINIDHHADTLNGTPYSHAMEVFDDEEILVLEYEYNNFKCGRVMEGSWVGWLDWKNKLKKYTWIHGSTSDGCNSSGGNNITKDYHEIFSANLEDCLREDYTFDSYKFDFIFVCLSPGYVPQKFWNIFTEYLSEYEKVTGKPYKLINRKYEIDARYRELHKYTLPYNK